MPIVSLNDHWSRSVANLPRCHLIAASLAIQCCNTAGRRSAAARRSRASRSSAQKNRRQRASAAKLRSCRSRSIPMRWLDQPSSKASRLWLMLIHPHPGERVGGCPGGASKGIRSGHTRKRSARQLRSQRREWSNCSARLAPRESAQDRSRSVSVTRASGATRVGINQRAITLPPIASDCARGSPDRRSGT